MSEISDDNHDENHDDDIGDNNNNSNDSIDRNSMHNMGCDMMIISIMPRMIRKHIIYNQRG